MPLASKTTNPLHFEDLEPRRFEDLARQLIYEFRNWNALEATGRQGADDGFDVRGWEVSRVESTVDLTDDDIAEEHDEEDRVWLIQCKREKAIGPKKIIGYLQEISPDDLEKLHGLLFVASCDFSKKSRDDFREWCARKGIREFYLWGRGELEDLLFSPRNDHLLFAYFGISLQIRQRSSRTRIRSILSMKRQVSRHIAGVSGISQQDVLIRDPEATEYPHTEDVENFQDFPKWRTYECMGQYSGGLMFIVRSFFAYYDPSTEEWDAEESYNLQKDRGVHWRNKQRDEKEWQIRNWMQDTPNELQGFFQIWGFVPFEEILAVDELGDSNAEFPHIYVRFGDGVGPFSGGYCRRILTYNPTREFFEADDSKRIKYFPNSYPPIDLDDSFDPPSD